MKRMRNLGLLALGVVLLAAVACSSEAPPKITRADFDEVSSRFSAAWVECNNATLGKGDGRSQAANRVQYDTYGEAATVIRDTNPAPQPGEPPKWELVSPDQYEQAIAIYTKGLQELFLLCPKEGGDGPAETF